MKSTVRFLAGVAIALQMGQPALSQSPQENHALKSAAWAQVIAHRCDKLDIDWKRLGVVLALAGLQPADIEPEGRRGERYGAHIREALNATKGQEDGVVCATGIVLYGPRGRNVPDVLTPK